MNLNKFELKYYNKKRTISVLLPPNYNNDKTYPTLYMHDGQNLFLDNEAFNNEAWRVDEVNKEFIIVGIHSDDNRLNEYAPFYNKKYKKGGEGVNYINWIKNELIPYITKNYQTNEIKYIAGSSLGSLISLYAIIKYPNLFNGAGLFSTSIWFNKRKMFKLVKKANLDNFNIFLSVGKLERTNKTKALLFVKDTKRLYKILNKKNLNLKLVINKEKHHELSWRKTFILFYEYLTTLKLF